MLKYLYLVLICITYFSPARAEEMPYILGVGVHHADFLETPIYEPYKTVKSLKRYNFDSFRDTLGWSTFSKHAGSGLPDDLRDFRKILHQTKGEVSPLLVFTSGNPEYNGGYLPTTREQREKVVAFMQEATIATKEYTPILELWNEWNLATGTRKKIKGTAEDYVALVREAYPAIKSIVPDQLVLVGGMASDIDPIPERGEEWVWTKKAIELGMLDYGDALSLHFYNICRPKNERRPSEFIGRLDSLTRILEHKTGNSSYPIYITEVGWPKKVGGCGFTEDEQISFSSQFLFWIIKYPSVKGVWLYELKDSGESEDNIEHHFGFLNYNYSEKPITCVIKEVRNILSHASFSYENNYPHDNRMHFTLKKENGDFIDIIWLPIEETTIKYTVPEGKTARFLCEQNTHPSGQEVALRERPLIVTTLEEK